MKVLNLLQKVRQPEGPSELEIALEAAKRATQAALHGPPHLRSGRYNPTPDKSKESGATDKQKFVSDESDGI